MVGNARTRAALVLGAFLAIGFALLIGEGACRLVEARAASTGASIAVDDRWTGWRMRPGYEGPGPDLPSIHGLSYSVRVNLLGFRAADVPVSKARGVVRIVALGDSVTFGFGVEENETYLALVAAALSSIAAPVRIESINAAVPGYTSLQGLRSLDRVLALRPDVVTILFGWNDGWLTIEPYAVRTAAARTIVQSSALLTALTSWKEAKATSSTAVRSFHYVPPDDFEANLRSIARELRQAGAVPVLLTAPAAFGPGIPPERYFHGGWVGPGVELEPKHQRYAAAVRRVAADQSIVLVDCARLIPPDRDLFLLDGYHPNRLGHRAIAALIVVALRADRLVARKMQPTW